MCGSINKCFLTLVLSFLLEISKATLGNHGNKLLKKKAELSTLENRTVSC